MDSPTVFTVGEIVRVLDPRFDRFDNYYPLMGQILGFEKRERYRVRLGLNERRQYQALLDTNGCAKIRASALDRWTSWKPKDRARFLFGDDFHHLQKLTKPFGPDSFCIHQTHDGHPAVRAVRRIMFNFWGTVCEFDACKAHADLDGCYTEIVPWSEVRRDPHS